MEYFSTAPADAPEPFVRVSAAASMGLARQGLCFGCRQSE